MEIAFVTLLVETSTRKRSASILTAFLHEKSPTMSILIPWKNLNYQLIMQIGKCKISTNWQMEIKR
jgi:hypothetical protein